MVNDKKEKKTNNKKTALIIPRFIVVDLFNLAPKGGEGWLKIKMTDWCSKRNAKLNELFYSLQIFTESRGLRNRPFYSDEWEHQLSVTTV